MYKPRTTPRQHQATAIALLPKRPKKPCDADVMAWLMEMGTGKSKIILDEFGQREASGDLNDLVVIGLAGSYRNWDTAKTATQRSEYETHLSPDLYRRLAQGVWISGGAKAVRRRLEALLDCTNRPRVLLVNFEALSAVEDCYDLCAEFLSQPNRRAMLVVDESTAMRSAKANRTERILQLAKMPNVVARRIMTGLVTPKSPLDLFTQFEFLDKRILGFDSFVAFRARYAKITRICYLPNEAIRQRLYSCCGLKNPTAMGDAILKNRLSYVCPGQKYDGVPRERMLRELEAGVNCMRRDRMLEIIPQLGGYVQMTPKIEGFQNLDEIQRKIAPYSYRVLKEDCLDLPPKIYLPHYVELTKEQTKHYEELKEFATSELDNGTHVTATNVLAQMTKLHQVVCGFAVDEMGELHAIKSNRIKAMLQVLSENEGKAIIWAHHQHVIDAIVAALVDEYGPEAVAQFHGRNKATRGEDEKKFLGNPDCLFMVASYAGAWGNTWVNANLVFYFENTYDLEKRSQSEDRSHRDGLKHSVTYVDAIVKNTVDEKIIQALRLKMDLAAVVTGDNYREWLI